MPAHALSRVLIVAALAGPPLAFPCRAQVTTRPAAELAAAYKPAPGPFRPQSVSLTLHDRTRAKELSLRIRYPADAGGPLPVIVFSHGMGGSGDAFPELTAHWASHGYVVVLPTHADSIRLRRQRGEDTPRSLREFRNRRELRNVDPLARLDDCRLVLDSLAELETQVDGLRDAAGNGRLDRERLAIAGHSAGAYTAQLAIGVKARTRRSGGRLASIGDGRFKAAILISGQGLTNRALARDSWSELSQPMLVITGSRDTTPVTDETPASRRHPYEYAKAGDKYLLDLEGATHSSFAGKNMARLLGEGRVENPEAITAAVACATLAFWDAYLGNDAAARDYLRDERIEKLHAIVRAEHK